MSIIPPADRPGKSGKDRPLPESTPDPLHDSGRHVLPSTPVLPRFADQTPPQKPSHRSPQPPPSSPQRPAARRGGRGWIATVVLVLGLPVILVALFLPPISLWQWVDDQLNGDDSPAEDNTSIITGGLEFLRLSPTLPNIEVDGLRIVAPANLLVGDFGVHVELLSPVDYLAGNLPAEGWFCAADLPSNHTLAGPVYSLAQTGSPPDQITVSVTVPTESSAYTDQVELHTWNAASGQWEFVPALRQSGDPVALEATLPYLPRCLTLFRNAESARRVGLSLALQDQLQAEVLAANARLYPGSMRPTTTGALQVILAPGFQTGQGYDVLPMISNFDDPAVIDLSTVQQLLANPALRSEHARQVAAFALSDPGYTGVAIDYRAIPIEQRADYTAFLTELADLLHGQDRTLTIVLPTPTLLSFDAADSTWETGGYDWPALGRIADEIIIQISYPPSMYLSDGLVDGLLSWATSQISRSSLHLGVDALSQQEHQDGGLTTITLSEAFSYLGSIQLSQQPTAEIEQTISARLVNSSGIKTEIGTDPAMGPYLRYLDQDGKLLRTLWITDAAALRARLEIAARHNLGGVFVWNIMSPGVMPGLAGALLAYQLDQPLDTSDFNAELTWTVRGGDTVIAGGQTALDQAFQFESSSIPAILTIEAALSGQIVAHTELIVTLPQSTPTETLSPTETPAPTEPAEPTPIPTESQPVETQAAVITEIPTEAVPLPTTEPVIEAPTETAAEVSFQPTDETSTETPVETATETSTEIAAETPSETTLNLDQPLPVVDPAVLAAADTGDTFEAGVHLSQVGPVLLEAGKLHAQWIKLDITYRIGMTPGGEQRHIEDLQGAGFKVLFNVTGDPVEFANITRPDYIAEYAGYVGGLALYGADGIEIWREMNGQMTSAEYMQILAYGFAAIKNANPNTLVISGALLPTPTADTPEQSDKVYYEQLAGAGAAQYLDCIGQQYTLGTVAPSGTSGDPRGDNPVYYLPNSTDHARQAFGDTLPVCYTRFGYLSPEGYAPLPEAYAWAQNITAAQQAQWLAEAVQLSQQGNQVRMLIAWTLDASGFAPDSPESGYALIRPDGTCPACEALEPLLKPAP